MKKLLYVIIVVLIITALAGCNYTNKPAVSPYNTYGTNVPNYQTAAPYYATNTPNYGVNPVTGDGYGTGGTGTGINTR